MSHQRKAARFLTVQALYQWEMHPSCKEELYTQIRSTARQCDDEYFKRLLYGCLEHQGTLIPIISPHLSRGWSDCDAITRAILILGTYELIHEPSTPYRVVINECLELTKQFGSENTHQLVNAVLDPLAKTYRSHES